MTRPVRSPGRRRATPVLGLLLVAALSLLPATAVLAAGTGTGSAPSGAGLIDYVEADPDTVRLLVSTDDGTPVDLDSVQLEVDGTPVEVTATQADDGAEGLRRTTVLLIDTSRSMAGDKIAAAREAVSAFLDGAPPDLRVGVVGFADEVTTLLEPVADPDQVRDVVADITLTRQTRLVEGVEQALEVVGRRGQRQVLLLSDGRDTTGLPVEDLLAGLEAGEVQVDAVALSGTDNGRAPAAMLPELAAAGGGRVIEADPESLAEAFSASAEALTQQVVLTAPMPDPGAGEVSVTVSLTADGTAYEDRALSLVDRAPAAEPAPYAAPEIGDYTRVEAGWQVPSNVALGAIAAIGAVAVLSLTAPVLAGVGRPQRRRRLSVEDRVTGWAGAGTTPADGDPAATAASSSAGITQQAKDVAAKALAADSEREARITRRLETAGSGFKASEWVLVHAGVTVGGFALGFLLGGLSLVLALVLGAVGAVAPPVYLKLRGSRRRAKFSSMLADTLQLMAGSLQAGQSLAQSIDTVVREGQDPISAEFRRVLVASRLGIPLEDAMTDVAKRMESEDFEWVVMAVKIQRQVGGNLSELLVTVADTLREREFLRRHVKALSAEGRLSMYVLAGLPPVFLLYLTLTNYTYVEPLYTTTLGYLMIGGAVTLLVVGMLWMAKIVDVDL